MDFPKLGQGVAVPADSTSLDKDTKGFTHPNLHRRIDAKIHHEFQTKPDDIQLTISGVESYRTETLHNHDEESRTLEIP